MSKTSDRLAPALLVLALASPGLHAQFVQYTPPGALAERPSSLFDQMEQASEDARWSLGSFKLEPWLGLRNIAWVDNVFATEGGETSDLTATVGAGLMGYLQLSQRSIFTIHGLPEYVWWQDFEERRRLNGRYGAAFLVSLNRLSLGLDATHVEEQSVVTPEFDQLTHRRRNGLNAQLDFRLVRSLRLWAKASRINFDNLLELEPNDLIPSLDRLDREETALRAGLAFPLGTHAEVAVGLIDLDVEFDDRTLLLDHEGTSPTFEFTYDSYWIYARLITVFQDLETLPGSQFTAYDDTTGSALVQLGRRDGVRLDLYGAKGLIYTFGPGLAYLDDETVGAALNLDLGRRTRLRLFSETGEQDFVARVGFESLREDDYDSLGLLLTFDAPYGSTLSLRARETDFSSNVPGFDRTVRRIGFTFNLGDVLSWP